MQELSVEAFHELQQRHEKFFLLDVREPFEYETCHLGGTLIPLGQLQNRLNEIEKDQHVIVHCKHGGRSRSAAEMLSHHGFTQVSNLTGGIIEWIEKIDPTLKKY